MNEPTTLNSRGEAEAYFRHLFHDPLRSYHELPIQCRTVTGCEQARIELYDSSAVKSVALFREGDYKIHELTDNSLAAEWLSGSLRHPFAMEQNARTLGRFRKLPDEWESVPEFEACESFLSILIVPPNRRFPTWGTVTLAHRQPHFFNEQNVNAALDIINNFRRYTDMKFLTDVCHTLCDMDREQSIRAAVERLRQFFLTQTPLSSLSVAVRRDPHVRSAVIYIDDGSATREHRGTASLREKIIDLEANTIMKQFDQNGTREPVIQRVDCYTEERFGNTPVDILTLLPEQQWTGMSVWTLPLWKPRRPMNFQAYFRSIVRPVQSDLIAVIYGSVSRNAIKQVERKLHSLSPIFALLLESKLREGNLPLFANLLGQQQNLSTLEQPQQQPQPPLPGINLGETELTVDIKKLLTGARVTREHNRDYTDPSLRSIEFDRIVFNDPAKCLILKGTENQQKTICAKVLPVRRLKNQAQRIRLELAICRCVSHEYVLKSRQHFVGLSGRELLKCCTQCSCHGGQSQNCIMHKIQHIMSQIAKPCTFESLLWDVMVMDYCDLGNLSTLIHKKNGINGENRVFREVHDQSVLNLKTLVPTLLEMAKGLQYLHKNGIVHGDFKPENVLVVKQDPMVVRRGWSVKIMDFGTSRVLGFQSNGFKEGTLVYAPPELVRMGAGTRAKHQDGVAGDVYAFGISMWEMMEGKIPFEKIKSRCELEYEVAQRKQRPILTVACPQDLQSLLDACLRYSPTERPSSDSIVDQLQNVFDTLVLT